MWRAISECHRIQKCAIDEAKPLIFSSDTSFFSPILDPAMRTPLHVGLAAAALEAELKAWRRAFSGWVGAQQAYASALLGWAQRCCGARQEESREGKMAWCEQEEPGEASRMWRVCWRWARGIEGVSGAQVMDGLDFFAAGMGSVCVGLTASEVERKVRKEEDFNNTNNNNNTVQMVGQVVFAGLLVAVSVLGEYAAESGKMYEGVVRKCKCKEACTCRESEGPKA
jgi:Protein of unknown function (DUF632)